MKNDDWKGYVLIFIAGWLTCSFVSEIKEILIKPGELSEAIVVKEPATVMWHDQLSIPSLNVTELCRQWYEETNQGRKKK